MDKNNPSGHIPVISSLSLIFAGNILASCLGALAMLLVSRKLSVSDFGLFTLALAAIRMLPIFTNFGLDTSTMKFASSYLRDGKTSGAIQIVKATLLFRLLSIFALTLLMFYLAQPLSRYVFHSPELTPLLRIASAGVLCTSLFNYFKSILWAYQLFKKSVVFQLIADAGKLLAIALFAAAGMLTASAALTAYSLSPLMGLFAGGWNFRRKFFSKEKKIPGLLSELFAYTKWIYLSEICKAALSSLDLFIVSHLLGSQAAGVYGLAANLTYFFPVLAISLRAVLIPHVSRFTDNTQFKKYITRSLKVSLGVGLGFLPLLLFSKPLILFFFGARYLDSVPIFNLLFLGDLIYTIQFTVYLTLYALNKPRIIGLMDSLRLCVLAIGFYQSVLHFGLLGPPLVSLAANLATLGFFVYYLQRLTQPKPHSPR